MSEKRRGLGRGLGALIPSAPATATGDRPVDVFFPGRSDTSTDGKGAPPARSGVLTEDRPEAGVPRVVPDGEPTTHALPGEIPAAHGGSETPDGTGGRVAGTPVARVGPTGAPNGAGTAAPGTARPPGALLEDGRAGSGPATSGDRKGTGRGAVVASDAGHSAEESGPELVPVPGAEFAELPVSAIRPNPRQPRQVFDEEALAELAHSVREVGVLQPVVVRRAAAENGEARYELIMGERRWRATQEAGLDRIPAIIRETSDDALLRDALLENLHRSELNPLEEAAAYQQLLEDFGCTHEELATRIGRSRPQISNTIRLLRLPALVQRRLAAGVLSAGHARALLGLDDTAGMERLAQRIVAEGLSVRAIEEIVALGDGPVAKPAKRRPRPGGHTGELDVVASRLGDKLDTRVAIMLGKSRGRLTIDFASVDDLNRIIGLMTPEVRGAFRE